jgi:hypothetical protein
MISTTAIPRDAPSFLRQWHHMICGFDTLFFGMAGSHNDINVLHRSLVFDRLLKGTAPMVNYEINANAYATSHTILLMASILIGSQL